MAEWPNGGRNYGGPAPIGGQPAPSLPPGPPMSPTPPVPPGPPFQAGPIGAPLQQPVMPPGMAAGGVWQQPVSGGQPMMAGMGGGQPPRPGGGGQWWQDPKRKPLVWTIGAGAVLAVIVAVVMTFTMVGGGGSKIGGRGSAGDLVKSYLEALARGDAQAALGASDNQPGSTEFLSDEILKQQIAKWPISNIRILGDDSSESGSMASKIGFAQVHVAATFGEKTSDVTWMVKKQNGRWRLDNAAVKIEAQMRGLDTAAAKTLKIFGKPVGDEAFYVFPGWLDVSSSNPYITLSTDEILLDKLSLGSYAGAFVEPTVTLNDAGTKAVNEAIASAFAACQSSNQLAPPKPCPVAVANYNGSLVDGTAKWGAPDLSGVKQSFFDPRELELHVSGEVRVPVSAQERSGGTRDGEIKDFLNGQVDLTSTPPKAALS